MAEIHVKVRELFLAAREKAVPDRESFLAASGADQETVRQVRELLRHDSPHTVLDVRAPQTAGPTMTLASLPRFLRRLAPLASTRAQRWITGSVLLILLAASGQWLRTRLRTLAVEEAMSTVQALQESNARSIQDQIVEWRESVDAVVAASGHAAAIAALRNPDAIRLAEFHQHAGPLLVPGRFDHYALFNAQGTLLGLDGRPVAHTAATPFGVQMIAQALAAGKTHVAIPGLQRTAAAFAPEGALLPRIAFYAPLRVNGEPAGVFFVLRHLGQFAKALHLTRTLQTGECFLFNPDGVLMTPSRFEKDLVAWGLAQPPAAPGAAAVVYLRDPGRVLAETPPRPGEVPARWERTLLLRTVLAARDAGEVSRFSGSISEPYRDYRGEPVVSSWRWMPELGLGIATEFDAAEVLRTPLLIDRALLALLSLLGLGCIWAVVATGWIFRLHKRAAGRKELGPYSLLEKIGEGGMGEVFLAQHALLKRTAAVKLLRRDRDNEAGFRQFEREAQLVSRLRHPNTVDLYDFGVAKDGTLYFVMEYLPGLNLAEWVKRAGPMSVARSIHVVRQVTGALAEAHEQELLHCDVKPNNVMLCSLGGVRDVAKLLDFGLAHSTRALSPAGGQLGGTPYYSAPERLRAGDLDGRCDLYSVGILWFHLLTGRLPYPSGVNWLDATLNLDAPRVSSFIPVDPEVDELILSCTARDPAGRPATAQTLLARLNLLAVRFPWGAQDAEICWKEVAP